MKVALYTRVSTDDQHSGIQTTQLKRYCKANDYKYILYNDQGKSGKDIIERPEFQRMMKDAEKHKFDKVIVSKVDRLGRSVSDLVSTIDKLQSLDIKFTSLGEQLDVDTPTGKLVFVILSGVAEWERETIRERIIAGMGRLKELYEETGKWSTKNGNPIGRPRIETNVEKIISLYQEGLGYRKIGRIMNLDPMIVRLRLKEAGIKPHPAGRQVGYENAKDNGKICKIR